jgi:hypothetical protein
MELGGVILENDMKKLLGRMCAYRSSDRPDAEITPTPIGDAEQSKIPRFIGIDGSYSFLFSMSGMWLGVVRIGALEYRMEHVEKKGNTAGDNQDESPRKRISGAYRLEKPRLREVPVLVTTNPELLKHQDGVMQQISKISSSSPDRHVQIINRLRTRMEQELALEVAGTCHDSIICIDGSLTDVSHRLSSGKLTLLPDIIKKCGENGNILVGISKDSATNAFCKVMTDEEYLSSVPCEKASYVRVPPRFEKKNREFLYGDVYFAKLHPDAPKWFRVDIGKPGGGGDTGRDGRCAGDDRGNTAEVGAGNDGPGNDGEENAAAHGAGNGACNGAGNNAGDIFRMLAAYSRSPVCPGYPYPMLDAHRFAVVVRQFRELYEDMVLKLAREHGLGMDRMMKCITHVEGKARGAFHEYLDMVTREIK